MDFNEVIIKYFRDSLTLVQNLSESLKKQTKKIEELEEKLRVNSQNPSKPPSTDFNKKKKKKIHTKKSNNKPGGRQILGVKFLRQRPILNFIVDFFAPEIKLAIEIDGSQHYFEQVFPPQTSPSAQPAPRWGAKLILADLVQKSIMGFSS